MGSKKRLLPWVYEILDGIDFQSAMDPFSGTGSVGYLIKSMGRRVASSDFLNFSSLVARATIENNTITLDDRQIEKLLTNRGSNEDFIQRTFKNVFYTHSDLEFLDRISGNIRELENPYEKALAYAALFRSCLKRQPRGVFTISGNLDRYDDGRRDLQLSIKEHFLEQVQIYNRAVFDNGHSNISSCSSAFDVDQEGYDLVYLDPPYVPRSDDNCYIKRYHFLEGLSSYWHNLPVNEKTKVKKIAKKKTPFNSRKTAIEAFDRLFEKFKNQKIVLSYSSNGYPDLNILEELLKKHKKHIKVYTKDHRYHFGTHANVERSSAIEYLIVGE